MKFNSTLLKVIFSILIAPVILYVLILYVAVNSYIWKFSTITEPAVYIRSNGIQCFLCYSVVLLLLFYWIKVKSSLKYYKALFILQSIMIVWLRVVLRLFWITSVFKLKTEHKNYAQSSEGKIAAILGNINKLIMFHLRVSDVVYN